LSRTQVLLTKIAHLKSEIRDNQINKKSIFNYGAINNTRDINLPEIDTLRYKDIDNRNIYGKGDPPCNNYLDKMSRNQNILSYSPNTSHDREAFPGQRLSSLTPPEHIPSHTETPSSSESVSDASELDPPSSMGNKFEEASWNASSSELPELDSRGGGELEGEDEGDPILDVTSRRRGLKENRSKRSD
jgi:hypothetical protein